MKKLLPITLIGLFGFASIAWALPFYQKTQGLVPDTTDTHYIGTSSPSLIEYNGIFTKDITISGTCTGCGTPVGGTWATTSTNYWYSTLNPWSTTSNIYWEGTQPLRGVSTTLLADTNIFSTVGTTTFLGNLYVNSHTAQVTLHNLHAHASDGLFLTNVSGSNVALFGAGGGQGTTFYDGVNITGQTTLATSLNGLAFLTNGVVSAQASSTMYQGTNGQVLSLQNGLVTSVATTTFSAPLTFANGNVTCTSASSGVTGCLTGTDWNTFNGKQDLLVSGTNIKTINGASILASGDLTLSNFTYPFPLGATSTGLVFSASTTLQWLNSASSSLGTLQWITATGSRLSLFSGACNSSTQKPVVDASGTWTCGTDTGGSGSPVGNTGAIQFNNASAFYGDETSFIFDNTNKKLGISTSTPWARLSVMATTSSRDPLFIVASSTSGIGTTTALIIDAYGKIAVGHSSPTFPLDVRSAGGASTISYINLQNTSGSTNSGTAIDFSTNSGSGATGRLEVVRTNSPLNGDTDMRFSSQSNTSVVERMRINTSGNLGIATTSPYAKLSVVGEVVGANFTATTTATSTFPSLLATNATSSFLALLGTTLNQLVLGGGTTQSLTSLSAGTNGNVLAMFNGTPSYVATTTFSGTSPITATFSGGVVTIACPTCSVGGGANFPFTPIASYFGTTTQATTTALLVPAIFASSSSYFGKIYPTQIGVNDTAPGETLDVTGAFGIENPSQSDRNVFKINNLGMTAIGTTTVSDYLHYSMLTIQAPFGSTSPMFDVSTTTTSTYATTSVFTIAYNGNIGVASTSPWGLLSINGTSTTLSTSRTDKPFISIASSTKKTIWGIDQWGAFLPGVQNTGITGDGNRCMGTSTLSSGKVTVSTGCVSSGDVIWVQRYTTTGAVNVNAAASYSATTISSGVSFVASSSLVTDSSIVQWWIQHPQF